MKRPGYREAIRWIVDNDDTSDIQSTEDYPNVTGSLVADLFDVTPERVVADILRALKKDGDR
jgi:hypothetical protein